VPWPTTKLTDSEGVERLRHATNWLGVLLVVEGLVGAAWVLWLIVELVWFVDVASLLEVSSPIWAGAIAAQMSAFGLLPSLAVAWLGRRWLASPPFLTSQRRVGIYMVVAAHVVAGAVGCIVPARGLVAVGAIGAGLAVAVLIAGLRISDATDAEQWPESARPVRWGRVLVGSVAAVLGVSAAAAIAASLHPGEDILAISYDEDVIVCRGAVDVRCASEAARRAGMTVAWLPDRKQRRSEVFVVGRRDSAVPVRPGAIFQEGRADWVRYTLYTNPGAPEGGRLKETVVVDGVSVAIRIDTENASFAYLDWADGGVAYRLVAFRTSTDAIEAVVAEATRMVTDVRYSLT
jgi:hypothetical protein